MSDDLLARLLAVATDGEASILDDLAIRAGILWRCPNCAWHNVADDDLCGACGLPRPA